MSRLDWLTARPIAHRGYHDTDARRIENTLDAAVAAIERGFAIECDVRVTADGAAVVFHDDTLDRLTEASGAIARLTLNELRSVRFRDGDARIPTLEDVLDLVDGRVVVLVELKSPWTGERHLEAAVASALSAYDGPAAVMSFDPGSMTAMRRLAPALPRGLTAGRFHRDHWPTLSILKRLAHRHLLSAPYVLPSFTAYDVATLTASAPLALRHFLDLPLLTWTVRDADNHTAARQWADQIIFEGFDPDLR